MQVIVLEVWKYIVVADELKRREVRVFQKVQISECYQSTRRGTLEKALKCSEVAVSVVEPIMTSVVSTPVTDTISDVKTDATSLQELWRKLPKDWSAAGHFVF